MTWSEQAPLWAELWGGFADPVRERIATATPIGRDARVLDVGCGSGELLMLAAARGAEVSGIDAAEGMLAIARRRLPDADLRLGAMEEMPWEDGRFDVVTAVNALQFAPDFVAALRDAARVARPGGRLAIANWGPREDCEVNVVDDTVSPPPPGEPPHRRPGGLSEFARQAGLSVLEEREVAVPFELPDAAALERAFRFDVSDAPAASIIEAAAPFRRPDGSYRFENRFNLLVAEV